MNTATTPPTFIGPDSHTGRVVLNRLNTGHRVSEFTASDLAEFATEGVLWESFGHPGGSRREHFARVRYIADSGGNLHCYASNGHRVVIHPAARTLRVIAKN